MSSPGFESRQSRLCVRGLEDRTVSSPGFESRQSVADRQHPLFNPLAPVIQPSFIRLRAVTAEAQGRKLEGTSPALPKLFRRLTKLFRRLTKPLREAPKLLRIVTKPFRNVPKLSREVPKQWSTVPRRTTRGAAVGRFAPSATFWPGAERATVPTRAWSPQQETDPGENR